MAVVMTWLLAAIGDKAADAELIARGRRLPEATQQQGSERGIDISNGQNMAQHKQRIVEINQPFAGFEPNQSENQLGSN